MNLVMICERFPPDVGGLATSGARIAATLSRLGYSVDVLVWSRHIPSGLLETEQHEGARIHRLGRFSNWDLTLQHTLNVLDWLNEQKNYDIIWGHYLQPAGFLAVMYAKANKLKSVVSARGNDVDQMMFPPGDFARLKWTLDFATMVTSVSDELARKIRAIQGDDFQVKTIPNVVDLNIFSPGNPDRLLREQLNIEEDEVILGFSGELRHKKGLSFLPEALARVRKERPAVLLIIGEIRAREQSAISAFAAENPSTATRILSTGHIENPAEVARYLRICDIILQPSVWDGLPNAILEAMACQNLVLASDAGGIPEVIQHDVNGVIIPKIKLHQLGYAILETLSLPVERLDTIKLNARKSVEAQFSPKNEEKAIRSIVEQVLR